MTIPRQIRTWTQRQSHTDLWMGWRKFMRLIGGLEIARPLASYAQEPKQPLIRASRSGRSCTTRERSGIMISSATQRVLWPKRSWKRSVASSNGGFQLLFSVDDPGRHPTGHREAFARGTR